MNNRKNLFSKVFFALVIAMLVFVSGFGSANAALPSQVGPIQQGGTLYVGDVYFPVKSSGNYYTFCTSGINTEVPVGRTCSIINPSNWNEGQQAGVAAIIDEFNSGRTGFEFAEVAINSFLNPGSVSYGAESVSNVKDLVTKAKKAQAKANSEFAINLSANSLSFTESNGYYVSNKITVSDKSNILESYNVNVSGVDGVEVFNKNNNSFQVRFPSSKLERGKTVTVTAKVVATTSYAIAFNYYCGGGVQNVTINQTEPKTKTTEKSINGKVTKEETTVKISKQDITNKKELPGATLVVKDVNGKEVDKWVSTTEPHYIKNLEPGKYTLSETIAPKGYKLTTETISFEVKADGKTTSVVMYNAPAKGNVKISKQDITNKEELPGATLVIKDSKGKEIDKWVSTKEPHYIKDMEPGKYTLSETIAPEGYELTTETIEFEIKADGKTTSVVMYNKPKTTGARISKQDITNKQELPGATLVIKDKKGKEVEKWVSTTEPHFVELKPGKYTLSETIAPEGYKLSTTTIEFEVKKDGTITPVVMYNEPSKGVVKISKQDITTKEELPGATLVIKDANGNEIERWVSTKEPRFIELQPGEYTLTEITAPDGYDLSYEVVRFTVNEDGTTAGDVIMYNSKTPNTSDRNMLLIVVGFIGTGLASVFAIKKLKHQM